MNWRTTCFWSLVWSSLPSTLNRPIGSSNWEVLWNYCRIVPSRTLQHGGGRVTRVGSSAGTFHRGCETRDTSLTQTQPNIANLCPSGPSLCVWGTSLFHEHTLTFVRLERHCAYKTLHSNTNNTWNRKAHSTKWGGDFRRRYQSFLVVYCTDKHIQKKRHCTSVLSVLLQSIVATISMKLQNGSTSSALHLYRNIYSARM